MLYTCEHCFIKFHDIEDCKKHEEHCKEKPENVVKTLEENLSKLQKEYSLTISKKEISINKKSEYAKITYNIKGLLPNGNHFHFSTLDGLCLQTDSEDIYNQMKEAIEKLLPTKYEGIVHDVIDETGGYGNNTYGVGNLMLNDIAERLEGRKVRIEVIE